MNKNLLAISMIFGFASGIAHANLISATNLSHMTADVNSIEAYYLTTDASGSYNVSLSSITNTDGLDMDGYLSVWEQVGTNWQLIGFNDNAPFTPPANPTASTPTPLNNYGSAIHQWTFTDPSGGISDPGLAVNFTANNNYMIIQSDTSNGPIAQSVAVGSTLQGLQSVLQGQYRPGVPVGLWFNTYTLNINGVGNLSFIPAPAAVPLPAAVWLFGSALAGLGMLGRKKNESCLAC